MTKAEVMARLATVKDIEIDDWDDEIKVTVQDFEGFDEDWCEVFRDYDDEAVDAMLEWLEAHCDHYDGDFYVYFYFEGFEVCVGYTSFDI